MTNVEAVSVEYGKNPRGRPMSPGPTNPRKILQIVRLRDNENMRFKIIGQTLGEIGYKPMTTQGTSQLYQKWKYWAYSYMKTEGA
jgi:hypothetical protein